MNRVPFKLCSHVGLLVSTLLGLAGCQGAIGGDEMTGAEESGLDLGVSASALTLMDTPDPAGAAAAMTASSDTDGCKTRVRDAELPNVVHVFLNDCKGRFGRHSVSGEMVVTFSLGAAGTLHADHESNGLTIDGRDAQRSASADISFDGDQRHVVWHGEKSTTSEDGEEVTRVGDHVIDIDRATGCSVTNGTATVMRGDRQLDAVLKDLTSCDAPAGGRYCPTGTIEAKVLGRDVSITKTFDGSETAVIEVSKGHGGVTREVLLACTAQD